MEEEEFKAPDLGDPISFEDVLAIMTVVFVLFFLFMVPIVNLDKVKTEKVTKDAYWKELARYIGENAASAPAKQYAAAFEAYHRPMLVTEADPGEKRYVEFLTAKGDVHLVEHRLKAGEYVSLIVQDGGGVFLYRMGSMKWSARDGEWFTDKNRILSPGEENAATMLRDYRKWTKGRRGF